MNPFLDKLHPYPFEKLSQLKYGLNPPEGLKPIALSIGEPKHPTPAFIRDAMVRHLDGLTQYPATQGIPELRATIASWLQRRFDLPESAINPHTHVLPCHGTREALFAFAQAVIDPSRQPRVLMPNPFYQIYEGAALLAGAEPHFLNTTHTTGFLPDFDGVPDSVWQQCQLLYICSPGNPTGAILPKELLTQLIELADRFDFIIASDECYSELYRDETMPPPGLLQAAYAMGNTEFKRCVVFHSLSKRSNAPGLRSGFIAGDATILKRFLQYRTYHGCALSIPVQQASMAAWQDEEHVKQNRALYRAKFTAVEDILGEVMRLNTPSAGFYLWPETPGDDQSFTRELFAATHVTVLPGSFLSREAASHNPGKGHVRMALVATLDECVEAAYRIRNFIQSY